MIIYLHGPDSYARQEKLKWYVGKFKEKYSGMTVEHFDCGDAAARNALKSFATSQSLFETAKLGILENVGEADPKDLHPIFKLSSASKTLTLVISVEKPLSKNFKVPVDGENKEIEFPEPSASECARLARSEAEKRGVKLSEAVLDALIKTYLGDTWGLITELDRIALGASPEPFAGEQNFFSLTNVLQSDGPASYKLPALERLLQDNDAAAVFNFLASRANPESKTKMADWDVAIKSGKAEYEEALFGLALGEDRV